MKAPGQKAVAFFPSMSGLSANPYWPILASGLEKMGIHFINDTPGAFNIAWLLRNRHKVDILHLHFIQQFYSSYKGKTRLVNVLRFGLRMAFARILGFRTVFTLHNLEPTYNLQPVWMDQLGHQIAVNFSERIIVHSDEAHRLFVQKYGHKHHIFIVDHPNLIGHYPNTISKEAARIQLGLSGRQFVFTFFGGIRPNKGVETLIQAFRTIDGEYYRLIIAGQIFRPDAYAKSLKELASEDPRISFHLKYVPDDEIQVFMNAADVIVLPFAWILTSSSTILAMSFRRPVIAPRMGCLPELIEPNAGWLFEPNNPNSLGRTMLAASTSDVQQIGQNAFDKISLYSPERFAAQTIRAYWG